MLDLELQLLRLLQPEKLLPLQRVLYVLMGMLLELDML